MNHLDEITVKELRRALTELEEDEPTQRRTAAIAHKNGVTQPELAEWCSVQRRTCYSRLERLENRAV